MIKDMIEPVLIAVFVCFLIFSVIGFSIWSGNHIFYSNSVVCFVDGEEYYRGPYCGIKVESSGDTTKVCVYTFSYLQLGTKKFSVGKNIVVKDAK